MGIVTTTSETAFTQSAETVYDFVTNPANWTKTYPGSAHIGDLPQQLPLQVGDTWTESGPDGTQLYTWQLAITMRPRLWMFNSVGRLGHDRDGTGGMEGRITVQYQFTRPGADVTLFSRTMTIEAYRDAPLPDALFRVVNPANIDKYHAAVARELANLQS
ncbi:SRPBCC family protein [Mycobacterium sp. 21AC1]|uniref:SRPBCC family protein n=1 Tax=[Mycobacterium] appelbergii TaxID=2939269 RepID=UPI002939314E|nr:SRPBCC family protein [Mycobacterium sp. 21AC1]MDV3125258.1 SRPBCC family protein [Mycobacterium sp. 21AC1]